LENGEPIPTPHDPGRDREVPDFPSSAWSLSAEMRTSGPLNAQQVRALGIAMLTGVQHGGPDSGFIRRCGRGLPFLHVIIVLIVFLEVGIGYSDSLDDESGSVVGADGSAVQVYAVSEGGLV
jgi:hypothetical protein